MFKSLRRIFFIIAVGAALWGGYNYLINPPPTPPSLPDLPGHNMVEGQELTGYLGSLGEEAASLADQPELAQKVARVDGIIRCYQDVGAVQARLYSSQQTPLSAGVVAIADRNALLNPITFFNCVAPTSEVRAKGVLIEPCSANYTVSRDNNEYYILYAGTTIEICRAFCAQLEGCTAH